MIKTNKPPMQKPMVSKKIAEGPAQLKHIRKHDVSGIRKQSNASSDVSDYDEDFASDTEKPEKPAPIKTNPKLRQNPLSFKTGGQKAGSRPGSSSGNAPYRPEE